MNDLLKRLLGIDAKTPLSYEQVKELARHENPEVRRELAAMQDLRPEILYYLAEDPSPEVRREIAVNPNAPAHADLLLASDEDPEVRVALAAKIARVAPGLSAVEQDRLRKMTYEALDLLAQDQVTRVRQILSEAVKDMQTAPRDVVCKLAADAELSVSAPVLQWSPVLTDDDLLDIIESGPANGALSAISARSTVAAVVADAIACTDDIGAITVLLANQSAQIREETLDRLLDRAPEIPQWHEPMVRRPRLSARAASRLAMFVAENLLREMDERPDLDPETKAAVAATVRKRLGASAAEVHSPKRPPASGGASGREIAGPLQTAMRMSKSGTLTDMVIANAISANDIEMVMAALSIRARLPLEVVQQICASQNPKALVSLAWKSNLTPSLSVQLQAKTGRVPPSDILGGPNDRAFPLPPDEMAWQIDFFTQSSREHSF